MARPAPTERAPRRRRYRSEGDDVNPHRNGRRSAVVGAGAATLTAALILGPGTAAGAPADPADEVTQAGQEALDAAHEAAEQAA